MPYEINLRSLSSLLAINDSGEPLRAAADATEAYLQAFLYRLDIDRANLLGGQRSHFYAHAADGVTREYHPNEVDLVINETGFRQRLLGGKIEAVNVSNLTIPAVAEAYGHSAREFDLRFIMFRSGAKALVPKSGEDQRVWYWLVKEVTQEADPSVLPETAALEEAAKNGVLAYLHGVSVAQQTNSIFQDKDFIRSTDKYQGTP